MPKLRTLRRASFQLRATALAVLGFGEVDTFLEKAAGLDLVPDSLDRAAAVIGLVALVGLLLLERHLRKLARVARTDLEELDQRRASEEAQLRETSLRRRRIRQLLKDPAEPRIEFQPIRDLQSGVILGHEALARFSMGRPDEVFAEASRVGLGSALELKAMSRAIDEFFEGDVPGYLSVNCSPATLRQVRPDDWHGVDLSRLVLELTEHIAVTEYAALRKTLAGLRRRGVRIAVDDAGAGYASLQHIVHVEPEIIKLDQAFTRQLDRPHSGSMVDSLVRFAGAVGATIVAEGVETPDQRDALRELGVAAGQGWLLGRPGPLPVESTGIAVRAHGPVPERKPLASLPTV